LAEIDAREYAEDEDVVKIYEAIAVTPPSVDEEYRVWRAERQAKASERLAAPIPAIVVDPPELTSTATSAIPLSEISAADGLEENAEEPASVANTTSPETSSVLPSFVTNLVD
jgi:hypothetical protein